MHFQVAQCTTPPVRGKADFIDVGDGENGDLHSLRLQLDWLNHLNPWPLTSWLI